MELSYTLTESELIMLFKTWAHYAKTESEKYTNYEDTVEYARASASEFIRILTEIQGSK